MRSFHLKTIRNFTPNINSERLMSFLLEATRHHYKDSKKEAPTIDDIKSGNAKVVGKLQSKLSSSECDSFQGRRKDQRSREPMTIAESWRSVNAIWGVHTKGKQELEKTFHTHNCDSFDYDRCSWFCGRNSNMT